MRVLLISHIFPPAIDGGSKVVHKIGQYLESKHHQILYLSSDCKSTDDFINPSSKAILTKLKNHIYLPVYKHLRKIFKLLYLLTKKDIFLVFAKGPVFKKIPSLVAIYKIKKFDPEIIICGPLPTTIALYASFLKKIFLPKSKLIINASFHESDPDFTRAPLIKTLQSADLIWTLTKHETETLINHYQIPKNHTILLGNGVDQKLLQVKKTSYNSKNILFIGSFAAHKNIKTLISAFEILHHKYPQTTLTLTGQKTLYYPTIQKTIDSLSPQIKKSIKLNFNPTDTELIKLIDDCQFVVQPSRQESFGLTIIEANARKKPVIVSNIAAMSEIINNTHSGLIFDTNSPLDLARKMSELISDSKKCQTLGENGYQYVSRHYTWDIIGQQLESAMLSL